MASNDWSGKMKTRAQTLQEMSETVDKKKEDVQEDLEK